jgi:membrane glycosyltransferase
MTLRRLAILGFTLLVSAVLVLAATRVLGPGGWSAPKLALLGALALLAPWMALPLGHAVLGLALLLGTADPPASVLPAARGAAGTLPRGRTAIAICLRNEAMEAVLPALARLLDGLPREGFDLWFLSDTRDPTLTAAEDAAIDAFGAARADGARIHRRRRAGNAGYKAGNVMEFLDAEGAGYDHMLCLDADSAMTGEAVLRLVAIMEADARIGIIQQLIVGRPVAAAFPRLFQFGMRAGMRVWATGQAWWQGPRGPYWGHNALIRVAAFRAHARLEALPDGSTILSHDQVEAIRLHEAGWGVWCFPEEAGSMEGNPPALPEFMARDVRWAAGNMQYLALLRLPGLDGMSRWQLLQAILLFLAAPLWVVAFVLAVLTAIGGGLDTVPAGALAGLMLLCWAVMNAAKLAGYAQVLTQGAQARRHGGRARFLAGALLELVFTAVLAPISVANKARFLFSLPFGAVTVWSPQNRADRGVSWQDAARLLWPHTLAGVLAFAVLAWGAPWTIGFALPWAGGLLLAIPFCVASTSPSLAAWLVRHRLAATPEELAAQACNRAGSRLA